MYCITQAEVSHVMAVILGWLSGSAFIRQLSWPAVGGQRQQAGCFTCADVQACKDTTSCAASLIQAEPTRPQSIKLHTLALTPCAGRHIPSLLIPWSRPKTNVKGPTATRCCVHEPGPLVLLDVSCDQQTLTRLALVIHPIKVTRCHRQSTDHPHSPAQSQLIVYSGRRYRARRSR